MSSDLPIVAVYSRPGCHLCEILIEELLPLIRERAVLQVRNIEDRDEWLQEFGLRIPVVEIGGKPVCQFHLDRQAVLLALEGKSAAISTS